MFALASMSATQPTTNISCGEEDDIDFMSQFEIELGSQEASNIEIDANLEILAPKMLTNQKVWSPNQQSSTYEILKW